MSWFLYIVIGGFAVFVGVLGVYSMRDLVDSGNSQRG